MRKCLVICLFLILPAAQAQTAAPAEPAKRGFMGSLKQAATSARNKAVQLLEPVNGGEDSPAAYHRLTDTRLANIFKDPAFADSETWPKLAITITGYSPEVLDWMNSNQLKSNECMTYDVMLWTSAKQSEAFNGLIMCGRDFHDEIDGMRVGVTWRTHFPDDQNTGRRRTTGPLAPATAYPTEPGEQQKFFDGKGQFYLGNVFAQMGYDYGYRYGAMQVWVVSVNQQGGSAAANAPQQLADRIQAVANGFDWAGLRIGATKNEVARQLGAPLGSRQAVRDGSSDRMGAYELREYRHEGRQVTLDFETGMSSAGELVEIRIAAPELVGLGAQQLSALLQSVIRRIPQTRQSGASLDLGGHGTVLANFDTTQGRLVIMQEHGE